MPARDFNLEAFQEEPVLGILRGVADGAVLDVASAAVSAGLKFIEITFNTPGAPALIEKTVKAFSGSLCVGAGTVLSRKDAEAALSAGAKFIVSPTLNDRVAGFCRESQVAYFPGAYTPTEVEKAWDAGAEMVKIFPASQLGPAYFRELKGPFKHIRLLAVGGVRPDNIEDFFLAGASAVAVGASVFSTARMEGREFGAIEKDLRELLLAVRQFYPRLK